MENDGNYFVLGWRQMSHDDRKNLLNRMQLSTFGANRVFTQSVLESNANDTRFTSGQPQELQSVQNPTVSSSDESNGHCSASPPPLPPKSHHLKTTMASGLNALTNWNHDFRTSSPNNSLTDCKSTRSSVLSVSDTSSIYWVVGPNLKPKRAAPPPPQPSPSIPPHHSQLLSGYTNTNTATITRGGFKLSRHLGNMAKQAKSPSYEAYKMTVLPNSSYPSSTESLVDTANRTGLIGNHSFNKSKDDDDFKSSTIWNIRRKIMAKENYAFDGTDNEIAKIGLANMNYCPTLLVSLLLIAVLAIGVLFLFFLFDDYNLRHQMDMLKDEIEQLKTSLDKYIPAATSTETN